MDKGKGLISILLDALAVAPRYVRFGLGLLLLYLALLVGITTTR